MTITYETSNDASLWAARGKTLLALGQYADAEGAFRRTLDLDPGQTDASAMLAVALMAQGRREEARPPARMANHHLRLDPERDWRSIIAHYQGLPRSSH